MINWYYQLPEHTQLLGETIRYLAQYDYHPDSVDRDKYIHTAAYAIADHVWLENANGVVEVKRDGRPLPDHVLQPANLAEFMMVKLCAQIIE